MKTTWKQRWTAIFLVVAMLITSFQINTVESEAAEYRLSKENHYTHQITTHSFTSSAKFKSGGGLKKTKQNTCVILHYMNGKLVHCIYSPADTPVGSAKKYNPSSDSRTEWVTAKKGGYERYKYVAVAQAYLVDKTVSLSGISGSKSLMSLSAKERKMLVQAFTWYMEYSGYNRKTGGTVKTINSISGWSAAKQLVLFDQIYEAAKKVIPDLTITQECFKLIRGGNTHQPMILLKIVKNPKPKYASTSYSTSKSGTQKVTVNITKTDAGTGAGLQGAGFSISCDGVTLANKTTDAAGRISYTYARPLKTKKYSSTKKYVTNWDSLTEETRRAVTKNGYYQNKTKAAAAAKSDATKKANAEYNSLAAKTHNWTIRETKAPSRHSLSPNPTATAVEGTNKNLKFSFSNTAQYHDLSFSKTSSVNDYGIEATLKDAVYELYAQENILNTDNKSVVYKAGSIVSTLVTDKNGKASVTGLFPGRYYLKEKKAPKGFLLDTRQIPVDLTAGDKTVSTQDVLIQSNIKIEKTYDTGIPEEGAEFKIYNSKNTVVDTLVTDEKGEATSKMLPYGSYTVKQTKGIKGFFFLPDEQIQVNGTLNTYVIGGNDEPEYPRIGITKTKTTEDEETDTFEKLPEENAVFEIIDAQGNVVETLKTDKKGIARTGEMKPGTYTVHQTAGADNYAFVEDFQVTITEDDKGVQQFSVENQNNARKIRIQKTMSKNGEKKPESGAQFVVLDSFYVNLEGVDLSTQKARQKYVDSLEKEAVVGTITTDIDGNGSKLLTDYSPEKDFVVLQVSGAKGYALADPYFSAEHEPEIEDLHPVYAISANDPLVDYGKIKISKHMVTGREGKDEKTKPEKDAQFEILNIRGKTVETLTTDETGTALSGELEYGVYFIHQTAGSPDHDFVPDQKVLINEEVKQQTLEYKLANQEKPVEFVLTKKSSVTGKLLDGATYEIYNESGEKVANITTGMSEDEEGKAFYMLPYGTYTIREVEAPDGFKLSKEQTFTINAQNTPDGRYELTDKDEPVFGEIVISKKGDALTEFAGDNFQYEPLPLEGVTYELYTRDDILLDDGTVLWKAGKLLDEKTTNADGMAKFSRVLEDGTETFLFPQGNYYIKEKKAPYGWVVNEEEYDVIIHWDTKAEDMNDGPGGDMDSDNFYPDGNRPKADSGPYVLCDGKELNSRIKTAETVTFTWEAVPTGVSYQDVSSLKDGTVVLWNSGGNYYISSRKAGQEVYFNAQSSYMFSNCKNLKNIYFDNINTERMVDATGMFEECSGLTALDLYNFNTDKMEYITKMFYNCTNLKTIYTTETKILSYEEQEDLAASTIRVEPKYEFLLGTDYEVDDFIYTIQYNDGSEKEVELPFKEVDIRPETAAPLGEQEVEFVFSGSYATFGSAKTLVTVIDAEVPEDKAPEDITKLVEMENAIKTHTIRINKTDMDRNAVEGAEFSLYAECDIVNHQGKVLFRKGDRIATRVSSSEETEKDAVVSFSGLPSDMYKADYRADGPMFSVRETKAAPGYYPTDTVLKFDMSLDKFGNVTTIIHDYPESAENEGAMTTDKEMTRVYDSKTIQNERMPYVVLRKIWLDNENAAGTRPDSITIKATDTSGTVKTYTLSAENDWSLVTDIPIKDFSKYKYVESTIPGYWKVSEKEDAALGIYEVANAPDVAKINIPVVKKWNDNHDQDGIRPESITVQLFQNGKFHREAELSESNQWQYIFRNLDAQSTSGRTYDYEVVEKPFEKLTGDTKTGYQASYDEVRPTEENGYEYTTTEITNTHETQTARITIHKKIYADEIDWERWTPTFTFAITGTLDDGSHYTNKKTVTFTKEEVEKLMAESGSPAIQKAVVFEFLAPGTYTVTETGTEGFYELTDISSADRGIVIRDKEGNILKDARPETPVEKEGVPNSITFHLGTNSKEVDYRIMTGEAVFENNVRKGRINLKKVDDNKKPLKNVEFTLYDSNKKEISRKVTDSKGTLSFENLPMGDYEVVETRSVPGQSKLAEPLKVTIPLVLSEEEAKEYHADKEQAVKYNNEYYYYTLDYEITNSAVLDLPKTGSVPQYFLLILGIAVIFFGIRKRKQR